MPFRGRILVLNNLVASQLWQCLATTRPVRPGHAELENCFWDRFLWPPPSVMFRFRDEVGSRPHPPGQESFGMQFAQRPLTRPLDCFQILCTF